MIICVYVDDLLLTGSSEAQTQIFKQQTQQQYLMTDLGVLHYFPGIKIKQAAEYIFLS